jgi:hypothetical protein
MCFYPFELESCVFIQITYISLILKNKFCSLYDTKSAAEKKKFPNVVGVSNTK